MNHDTYSDDYLRGILRRVKTIAMIGASPNPDRPSHHVMQFLQSRGYRVIPVNPQIVGETLHGEKVYAALADIPQAIDMVDIFRRSELVAPIVDEAIAKGAKVIWMQLGVRNDEAAAKAEARGIEVVMNRCPAIEIPRLKL
jgi:predicted CoA-binding protein